MSDTPQHGDRLLAGPGFPGDTGAADPALSAALAHHDTDPDDPVAYGDVLEALTRARLLVPVVALLGEVEHDEAGLAHDKTSDMAAVLLRGADGRLALLGFSGTQALQRWNPEARPVPVTARDAAKAALQDEAAALVIDLAGPARCVVEGDDLYGLAAGWALSRVLRDGVAHPAWIRSGEE